MALENKQKKVIRARTDEDKQQKRRGLLNAAKALFSDIGYDRTSISLITQTAGESTGTFYLYFKNKTEIYRTLYSEAMDVCYKMIKDATSWPGMNVLAKLSAIAGAYYKFYVEYRPDFKILAIQHLGQKDFDKHTELLDDVTIQAAELLKVIESTITQGIESGELHPVDPWKTTLAFWGMMDGLMLLNERKNISFSGVKMEDLIKQALNMNFFGISVEKRRDDDKL